MKRKLLLGIAAAAVTASAQFNAPIHPLSLENTVSAQQNRTLSSEENYNSLTHAGLYVGILEQQKDLFTGRLGIYSQKAYTEGDTLGRQDLAIPFRILVGTPERMYFTAHYGVTPLTQIVEKDSLTLKAPINNFGLGFAVQQEEKFFRFGINADAFIGKPKYEENGDSSRAVLGVEEAGITFGSTPHELFSFDLGVFASGFVDTLTNSNKNSEGDQNSQERIAEISVPRIEYAMHHGSTDFPVMTSFGFTYAKKHNLYATAISASVDNHDAIITDSTRWHLKTRGNIPAVEEKLIVHPSAEIGFTHNRQKLMVAGEDNHPYKYDGEHTGFKWETSAFRFGFGLDFEIVSFIDYWLEYGHGKVNFEAVGDSAKLFLEDTLESRKEGFNRFTTGAEFNFQDIPNITFPEGISLAYDISYMRLNESALHNSFYGSKQYEHLNTIEPLTQTWRYAPYQAIQTRLKTNDFGMGIRAGFIDRTIELSGRVHFINTTISDVDPDVEEDKLKGTKFQFLFTYNLTDK